MNTLNSSVFEVPGPHSFKIFTSNDLERHRAESLYQKEPETVHWIKEGFRFDEVFLDIGANIGIYTLFAKTTHRDLNVISIEPFLPNYLRLNENLKLNKFLNVTPLLVAFSDKNSITDFYSHDLRTGASGGQIDKNEDESGKSFNIASTQKIITMPVDFFVTYFADKFPNHIKIDVDGVEKLILNGMKATLDNPQLRSLLIEINPLKTNKEELISDFKNKGFTADNQYNNSANHSRIRRSSKPNSPENIIFTRVAR